MAKLTKPEAAAHTKAEALLAKDTLTDDDREIILADWQESANHVNSLAGAFFTPQGLARDLSLEMNGARRVIDLCAGIGTLSLWLWWRQGWERHNGAAPIELVCVEANPAYVEIGRKMLPEATWVQADIFDLPDLGRFDGAISNPPFGRVKRNGNGPRYTGAEFEYHVVDLAADLATYGAFIIPQMSAGFRYSGAPYYERVNGERKLDRFTEQTGISFDVGAGLDTSIYADDWHGVSPKVEIACVDFDECGRGHASGEVVELPTVNGDPSLLDLIDEEPA